MPEHETQNRHHAGRYERHRLGGHPQGARRPAHDGALHPRHLRIAESRRLLPKYASRETEPVAVQHPRPRPPRRGAERSRSSTGRRGGTSPNRAVRRPMRAAPPSKRCRAAVRDLKAGRAGRRRHGTFRQGDGARADEFGYTGHTEYFGPPNSEGEPMMIMCSDRAARGPRDETHPRLGDRPQHLQREDRPRPGARCAARSSRTSAVVEPRIAVMALNPHAGDGGLRGPRGGGDRSVRPSSRRSGEGILAFGPFAADGLFAGGGYTRYDGILAMYHDQGLAPFKTLFARRGELHGGARGRADLARPRRGVRHRRKGPGRPAVDAQRDLRGHRHRASTAAHGPQWTANPLQRAEREKSSRDVSVEGPAADRQGRTPPTRDGNEAADIVADGRVAGGGLDGRGNPEPLPAVGRRRERHRRGRLRSRSRRRLDRLVARPRPQGTTGDDAGEGARSRGGRSRSGASRRTGKGPPAKIRKTVRTKTGQPGGVFRLVIVEAPKAPKTLIHSIL